MYSKLENMKALFVMTILGISTGIMFGVPFLIDDMYQLNGFMLVLTIIVSMIIGMTFLISVGNSKWANNVLEKL